MKNLQFDDFMTKPDLKRVKVVLNQINKIEAKKLFNEGARIGICAAQMNPVCVINPAILFQKDDTGLKYLESFDTFVNAYTRFQCINSETGRYPRFYKITEL